MHKASRVGSELAIVIALAACGQPSTQDRQPIAVTPGDTVGELLHRQPGLSPIMVVPTVLFRSDSLSVIWRLAQLGSFVVVSQPYHEPHLLVIDTATGQVAQALGRHGEGPGEFNFPGDVSSVGGAGGRIWVADPGLRRLTPLRLVDGHVRIDTAASISPGVGAKAFGGTPWSDSTFLISGTYGDGRFQVISLSGVVLSALGEQERPDTTLPLPIVLAANQEVLAVDHSRRRIFGAGIMNGVVRIYDSLGNVLHRAETPYALTPYYRIGTKEGNVSMQPQPATRYGYLGAAATERLVFALFSGRTIRGHQDGASAGRFIHVFNWEGKLVGILELPEAIGAIALTPDGRTILASRWEPEPAVLRIRVPQFP